ncbi:MAG: TIGR00282 family metallophosphoesterase [Thermodesulfobacteriota bacterium]
MSEQIKILFIGDIVGRPGRQAVRELLPRLKERLSPDMVIANGENAAGGFGLTPDIAEEIFSFGASVMTSGNHIWDKKEIYDYIDETPALIRPLNYPEGNPGVGSYVHTTSSGVRVAVVNLSGRVFLDELDCPFKAADTILEELAGKADIVFVDMHAEATSEKQAMGFYLDGRAAAVIGTHTHVQTSDEKILSGGTAYITDAGMTGPTHSVLGMKKEIVLERFLTRRPVRFEVAKSGVELQGVFVTVDSSTGRAVSIERIKEPLKEGSN